VTICQLYLVPELVDRHIGKPRLHPGASCVATDMLVLLELSLVWQDGELKVHRAKLRRHVNEQCKHRHDSLVGSRRAPSYWNEEIQGLDVRYPDLPGSGWNSIDIRVKVAFCYSYMIAL
jgi:hypothetical protein